MISGGAFAATSHQAVSHTRKAALAHLTKATSIERSRHRIAVNAVATGWVRIELIHHLLDNPTMARRLYPGDPDAADRRAGRNLFPRSCVPTFPPS
jgi:NAD(P)-dependent dehydrogenase (short-subunit alcohol dehydrogenase family)